MSLATNVGILHLPMGERPQYGQPYPEGIALAFSSVVDDASGGTHTFSINADPGFLYRLEFVNWSRGEGILRTLHAITVHRWASGKAPFGIAAFDLNWFLGGVAGAGFSVFTLAGITGQDVLQQIRRFPMGAILGGLAPGVAVQLMFLTNETNTDTITNELAIGLTYWKKEALFLPGFLSSFYESPSVPPLLRQP